jgi:riboflavin biosynthesis pyrimidine reductase
LEQLFPEPRALDVADVYGDLRLVDRALPDRPYVVANFVASVDGRATLGGRSGGLGNEVDRRLFLDLRTQVDAVMAGTATIAIERYGPMIRSPERLARRLALGLEPAPLMVTATRTMELPVQAPVFADNQSRIVVLTNSERDPPETAATLVVERIEGEPLDLAAGMERLRRTHGVRAVLLEGGPTLFAAMCAVGLVDELFLTLAPVLVGSPDQPTIYEGPALASGASSGGPADASQVDLRLVSVLGEDGYLYLRYAFEKDPLRAEIERA